MSLGQLYFVWTNLAVKDTLFIGSMEYHQVLGNHGGQKNSYLDTTQVNTTK